MKFAALLFHHQMRLNCAPIIRHLSFATNKLQTQTCHRPVSESHRLHVLHRCQHHLVPSAQVSAQKWTNFVCQLLKSKLGGKITPQSMIISSSLHTSSICHKSRKKKQSAVADEDEETDESDDEIEDDDESSSDSGDSSEDDSEDSLSDSEEESDDEGMPKDYKDIHQNLTSLRIDTVLSKGLNISRKKIEDSFFTTNLRLNGNVVTKKGKKVNAGDTLDIIKGPIPSSKDETGKEVEMVSLMRVVVKKVYTDKTAKDKVRVVLRRWKSLKLPKSNVM